MVTQCSGQIRQFLTTFILLFQPTHPHTHTPHTHHTHTHTHTQRAMCLSAPIAHSMCWPPLDKPLSCDTRCTSRHHEHQLNHQPPLIGESIRILYVIVSVHYIRIYGSNPPRTKPRMVYIAINSWTIIISVYIPTGTKNACYLSYLTLDTTS